MEDDFEELLCESDLLQDSSQESLTAAATDFSYAESDQEDFVYTSQTSQDWDEPAYDESLLPRASAEDDEDVAIPSTAGTDQDHTVYPNSDIIDKIESAFEQIADAMLNEKNQISITLKTRHRNLVIRPGNAADRTRILSFPGRSADEAWRFGGYMPLKDHGPCADAVAAVVIRILELMHEALRNDVVLSKRDIYYRDPALFGSQKHVDRYVDDIAFTFGVTRTAMNVTAVAKGLIAGAVTFCRRDGSTFTTAEDQDGMLVPALKDILSVDMAKVRWVLVIEKEATFRSITASTFWEHISTEGVILTGKGYPDLASRAMLHFLTTASPRNGFASPPVYGLADFDPDGVAILSTYKLGSKALAHENEGHSVPQLHWLGLRSEHLLLRNNDSQAAQGVMMLTPRDRRKAARMLEEPGLEIEWLTELQRMLMLNMKAELQLLDAIPGGTIGLLEAMRMKTT